MTTAKLNYIVDALMGLAFLVSGLTGLILFFFLPSGVLQGRYQEFLGLRKQVWLDTHNWSGLAFTALVLLHIVLHWKWIVCMTKNVFSKKQ